MRESFDLVISNLSLHWVNDLLGCLLQVRDSLKPDGLFLAAMLGGDTLQELREVLVEAELAESGGVSPRISPFADLRDAGGLLQRAGFALPVVDSDRLTASYPDVLKLMHDLRFMGEGNAGQARAGRGLRRATIARADELYRQRFGDDGHCRPAFRSLSDALRTHEPEGVVDRAARVNVAVPSSRSSAPPATSPAHAERASRRRRNSTIGLRRADARAGGSRFTPQTLGSCELPLAAKCLRAASPNFPRGTARRRPPPAAADRMLSTCMARRDLLDVADVPTQCLRNEVRVRSGRE